MKTPKFNYSKVIQFGYRGQWDDCSEYETDSRYNFRTKQERDTFKAELKDYQLAHKGTGQTRVISRRTPKTA